MSVPALTDKTRRSLRLLVWAALPVLALAGVVQITGVGIDILVLATAALVLFGLERSLGDLLGEWFGPIASALILILVVGALFWYFLADTAGRSQTDSFFAEAQRRGYSTVYYQPARAPADVPPASPDSASGPEPVATGGSVRRSSGSRPPTTAATVERPTSPKSETPIAEAPPQPSGRDDTKSSRSLRSFFRRAPSANPVATSVSIEVTPGRVEVARRVEIKATVLARGAPVNHGTVEFTVNGAGAGRVALNAQGVASTTFLAQLPGSYEVRARYSGSVDHSTSSGHSIFTVVARR